jgi:hypothetical protein
MKENELHGSVKLTAPGLKTSSACETARGGFRRPFHPALTRGPHRFKLVLCSCASLDDFEPLRRRLFPDILPPLSLIPSQETYFRSSTSDAEMDFSRSLAGHGSHYMLDSVPICPSPSPSLPYSSSLSKLGCLLSFQPNPSI